jgi:hypothetical protein
MPKSGCVKVINPWINAAVPGSGEEKATIGEQAFGNNG